MNVRLLPSNELWRCSLLIKKNQLWKGAKVIIYNKWI